MLGISALAFGSAELVHVVGNGSYQGIAPICRVETSEKVIGLSFDDGPDPTLTPKIVRLLEEYGGRATFFVIGEHAQAHPDLIELAQHAGMEIGNHTWSHPHLDELSAAQAASQCLRPDR